jgi:hypothetical protein
MWKNLSLIILVSSFVTFQSCKKTGTDPTPETPVDNHITFKVNQTSVEAKFKVILQDQIFNAYFKKDQTIEMQRLVENGNPQRLIFKVERIDLENITYPYTVNYSIKPSESSVSVTYVNANNVPFGSNTSNPDDFTLIVNSFQNNILNCSFNGTLYAADPTQQPAAITSGTLNLKLVEY